MTAAVQLSWSDLKRKAPASFPGARLLVKRRPDGSGVARLRYDGECAGWHTDEMECTWDRPVMEEHAMTAVDAALDGLAKSWAETKSGAS